jgi:glutamate dehydrogenase/leucine dehydrogenase
VDVPFGGAKGGGINCGPARLSRTELDAITRAFVEQTKEVIGPNQDIPAPDVNTNGEVMSWIMDEYSRHYGNVQRFSWEEDRITEELEKVMVRSYAAVRAVAEEKVDLRTAAFILGIRRVGKAATSRRSTREPISFD